MLFFFRPIPDQLLNSGGGGGGGGGGGVGGVSTASGYSVNRLINSTHGHRGPLVSLPPASCRCNYFAADIIQLY